MNFLMFSFTGKCKEKFQAMVFFYFKCFIRQKLKGFFFFFEVLARFEV